MNLKSPVRTKPMIQGEPKILVVPKHQPAVWGLGCCDCGLYHQFIISLDGQRIMLRPYRDDFLTALAHEDMKRKKK